MNIKILKQNNQKAFTLIEALVAISILMIAIASPMALAQKGLATATLSKDQMIAAFLAQDAVEAVKNIRDQIAVRNTTGDWLDNSLLHPCLCDPSTGSSCNLDFPSPTLLFCQIDTASTVWTSTGGTSASIYGGQNLSPALNITYTAPDIKGVKHFLKYSNENINTTQTKFKRYINIVKKTDSLGNPTLNGNEAIVNVRVFWDSPLGVQNIDVHDFIYNYSDNL